MKKLLEKLNEIELDALKTMYLNRANYLIDCESTEGRENQEPHIDDIKIEGVEVYDKILKQDGDEEIFDAGIYYAIKQIKEFLENNKKIG